MTVTPASFKIRFPEFISQTDARIQLFLDDAVLMHNVSYWGDKLDLGISYYTAHDLSKSIDSEDSEGAGGGGGGAISGGSVDGTSISFVSPKTSTNNMDSYYTSTSYGIKYLDLMSSLPLGAEIV